MNLIPYKNNIKVSVVMPAYNASRFIREAIESILMQNYDKFELLILDDGSRDNTFDIMKEYKNHPRVRIYRNKKNGGVGAARNRLLRLARGKYITPFDADDIMLLGNLKTLSKFLDTHPDIGVVYGDLLIIENDNKDRILRTPFIAGMDYNRGWDLTGPLVNHGGSMIRKSLMLKVGGYDETVYSVDDRSIWLKLAEITKFKYLRGKIFYIYRRYSKSLTKTDKKRHSDIKKITAEAIRRRYNFDINTL